MAKSMNSFGLDADDMEMIHSILAAYPEVETAILYGSRATGRFQPGSDIDLVLTGKNLTDQTILDIRAALSDSNSPYLFDIVAESSISDENLKREIDETGKFFYTTERSVWPSFPNVQKEARSAARRKNSAFFILLGTCFISPFIGFGVYVIAFMLHGGPAGTPSDLSNFVINLLGIHMLVFYPLLEFNDSSGLRCFLLGLPYAFVLNILIFLYWRRFLSR